MSHTSAGFIYPFGQFTIYYLDKERRARCEAEGWIFKEESKNLIAELTRDRTFYMLTYQEFPHPHYQTSKLGRKTDLRFSWNLIERSLCHPLVGLPTYLPTYLLEKYQPERRFESANYLRVQANFRTSMKKQDSSRSGASLDIHAVKLPQRKDRKKDGLSFMMALTWP